MVDLAAPSSRSIAAIHPFYWRLGYSRDGDLGYLDEKLGGSSIRNTPPNPIELQIVQHNMEWNPDTQQKGDMRTPVLSIELRSNVIEEGEGLSPGQPWVPVFYRQRGMEIGARVEDYKLPQTDRTVFGRARRNDANGKADVRLWAYLGESPEQISDVPKQWISVTAIDLMFERES